MRHLVCVLALFAMIPSASAHIVEEECIRVLEIEEEYEQDVKDANHRWKEDARKAGETVYPENAILSSVEKRIKQMPGQEPWTERWVEARKEAIRSWYRKMEYAWKGKRSNNYKVMFKLFRRLSRACSD